jgi:DNA-binding GntR family transcriptional regulator
VTHAFHETARQYVLNTLRIEILQGLHPDCTHLRQEEVAKRLRVSTTPVREAFRDLLAEGLVSSAPHKGVITRGLTARGVQEIYELRMILEPMLGSRACTCLTLEQLAAAEAHHQEMCKTADPEAWASLNKNFHDCLAISESGSRLFEISTSLASAAHPYVVLSMHVHPDIMNSNNQEHERILQAYRGRDESLVLTETRVHLANTLDAIIRSTDQWPGTIKPEHITLP